MAAPWYCSTAAAKRRAPHRHPIRPAAACSRPCQGMRARHDMQAEAVANFLMYTIAAELRYSQ
jgi:hypothetical protein